jgi:uncharacterized protein DUF5372
MHLGGARFRACGPAARLRAPDCTAPTGWQATRCWRPWSARVGQRRASAAPPPDGWRAHLTPVRPPKPKPPLSGLYCPARSAHAKRTALRFNRTLGSAEVVHPFHPLRGQRFLVLKVRTVSGVETLSLRDADRGSFAMPRDWTDWAPPGAQAFASTTALLVDAFGLGALAELIVSLDRDDFGVDR